jgi:hypothetical protein
MLETLGVGLISSTRPTTRLPLFRTGDPHKQGLIPILILAPDSKATMLDLEDTEEVEEEEDLGVIILEEEVMQGTDLSGMVQVGSFRGTRPLKLMEEDLMDRRIMDRLGGNINKSLLEMGR